MGKFPEIPEAQPNQGYQVRIHWETSPYNPRSTYYDWRFEMAKKGWVVEYFHENGTTIPYSFAQLSPMDD